MSASARFYDGRTSRAHDVTVSFDADCVHISAPDVTAHWPLYAVRQLGIHDGKRSATFTLEDQPDARLIIEDGNFSKLLAAALPRVALPKIRISVSVPWLLFWLVAAIGVTIIIYTSVPRMAGLLVPYVPKEWEDATGREVMDLLTGDNPACIEKSGKAALTRMVRRLAGADADKFKVKIVRSPQFNAYTGPGGYIVIFSELINRARNPDEVAGVLAHEMGHALAHHPTEGMIRGMGMSMLVQMMFGGGEGANTATLASNLVLLRHDRAMETAADLESVRLMNRAGLDARQLAEFFRRVLQKEGDYTGLLSYATNHPPTHERIAMIEEKAREGRKPTFTPVLNANEWQALRDICQKIEK